MDQDRARYGHVAWCYDTAASAYSLGAIGRAKRWHVGRLSPGDRVLYVGAGTGREVAAACAACPAIEVLCVEPCTAMARRLRRRLSPWADRVTILETPLLAAEGPGRPGGGGFDWVCGHFFFNVFDRAAMPGVVALAGSHVKPGGRLVVADFAGGHGKRSTSRDREGADPRIGSETEQGPLPDGLGSLLGSAKGLMRSAYYRPVNVAGWALGMCALHPIYDYGPVLEGMGFVVEERVGIAVVPGSRALYEVVCARKEQGG